MNNQVNQVVDQTEYYTKEETLYLMFLSEITSQRDYLRGKRKEPKRRSQKANPLVTQINSVIILRIKSLDIIEMQKVILKMQKVIYSPL